MGTDGEYFIGGTGFMGQDIDDSVINNNVPPKTQPGLWCEWIITDDNTLTWNEAEKFHDYKLTP